MTTTSPRQASRNATARRLKGEPRAVWLQSVQSIRAAADRYEAGYARERGTPEQEAARAALVAGVRGDADDLERRAPKA